MTVIQSWKQFWYCNTPVWFTSLFTWMIVFTCCEESKLTVSYINLLVIYPLQLLNKNCLCLFPGGIGSSMQVSFTPVVHLNSAYILRFSLFYCWCHRWHWCGECFHGFCDLKTVKNYFVPFDRWHILAQFEGHWPSYCLLVS